VYARLAKQREALRHEVERLQARSTELQLEVDAKRHSVASPTSGGSSGVSSGELTAVVQGLQQQRDTLTHIAERKTTRRMWTYFWGVAGQNALFIYLIYGPASWDIMEPVTYFYSQSLIIFWWTYFIFASKELSLSSWRQSFVDMYLTRGMRDTGWTDETTETYQRLGEMRTLCLERIEAQVRRCCPHPAPALLRYPMPRRIL